MKITKRQLRRVINEALKYSSRGPSKGPMAEVWRYFEDLGGWRYKLTSNGATFMLPTSSSDQEHGYFVFVSYQRGEYTMRWIKRVPTSEYPYSKVLRPQNGWVVGSVPKEIKVAVDEIAYDIATHETDSRR